MTKLPNIYRPYDAADRAHAYLHFDAYICAEDSIAERIRLAELDLRKIRGQERRTEPYQSEWLAQIARLEALISYLKDR